MAQLGQPDLAGLLREAGLGPSAPGLWVDSEFDVGARVSESIVVGWIDVAWPHHATPVEVLRDEVEMNLSANRAQAIRELEAAIASARRARLRHVRACGACAGTFVPGEMHDDALCQGCAERELGVVH